MIKVLVFGMTNHYAGMESFIINYYRNINKNNFHFDFLVTTNEKIAYEEEILLNGSIIHRIGKKKDNYFNYKKTMKKFFKNYAKDYDAIWVNTCHILNIDYLIYAKKYGIKTRILHSHASNFISYGNIIKKILYKLRHKLNLMRQKIYVTDYWSCSEEAAKYLFNKQICKKNKYLVIPNAIDFNRFKFNSEQRKKLRASLTINDDTIVFGHVGRLSPEKNHKYLIDVFSEYNRINNNSLLILIGEGSNYNLIKSYVSKQDLTDKVRFLNNRTDVNYLYSAMDVFVFPSYYEGLGIALLEAQIASLPSYASTGIPKEAKITDKLEFFNLEINPTEIAKKIYKSMPKRDKILLNKNSEKYNIEFKAKELEKVLKSICSK